MLYEVPFHAESFIAMGGPWLK